MPLRYGIELHLVEIGENGQAHRVLAIDSTPDVSDNLESMRASLEWMRECLGNAMYDHPTHYEKLSDRYTGKRRDQGDE
jgi:hypothetical protein